MLCSITNVSDNLKEGRSYLFIFLFFEQKKNKLNK